MDSNKDKFKQLLVMFFSEAMRSKRTTVKRAAEIARRILKILPKVETEQDALTSLWEIEKDFQEIGGLRQALRFGYNPSEIKVYEKEIQQYASLLFETDVTGSSLFLQEAAKPQMTIQKLCIKYPDFCSFVENSSEKATLLNNFQLV